MPFDPFAKFKFEFDRDGYFSSCVIPKRVEVCPCCGKGLVAQCTGWDKFDNDESGVWWPADLDIECVRGMKCYKEYEHSEQWNMPYVYWLPVEEHCKQWITRMLRIYHQIDPMPLKWLEKNGQIKLPLANAT